jgi:hypothetical protein
LIFTLEALRAGHGDCLLLHYGPARDTRHILIDGGPSGTYGRVLAPRLAELRGERDRLRLRLAMVSHIDDDHIAGMVDLFDRLRERKDEGSGVDLEIDEIWFNAFERLTKASAKGAGEVRSAATSLAAAAPGGESMAIAASVAQGVTVREDAERLGIRLNPGFDELVVANPREPTLVEVDEHLALKVVAPDAERVEDLRADWEEWEKKHSKRKGDVKKAEYLDRSVFNLSSIVVLAEAGKKRMLLTGDARGDDILEGLAAAGELKDGKCKVDLLKLPHHGSARNVEKEFFEAVPARHYVVSGNGVHDNPEIETLEMLCDARTDKSPWTLWLTYGKTRDDGHGSFPRRLERFIEKRAKAGQTIDARYGSDTEGLKVHLGDSEFKR